MQKKQLVIIGLASLLLIVAALFLNVFMAQQKEILYIGLAAPLSGDFRDVGHSMKKGVQLAIKEANAANPFGRYEFRLVTADDHSQLNISLDAEQTAKTLLKQRNLVGVVGHYFSQPTMVAGEFYRVHKIPFITPTATQPALTANNECGFGIMPDDYYQSIFLANYVIYGLARKKIAVVYSKNPYGQSLRTFFSGELKTKGVNPTVSVEIDHMEFDPEELIENLREFYDSDIIFLAMNYTNAARVIKFLRKNGVNTDFVGGESLGGKHFIQEAGIYADGVYAVTPYLPSLFGEASKRYQMSYLSEFQQEPDWVSTFSFEAATLLTHAVRAVGQDGTDIRNFLRRIVSEQDVVPSIAGDLIFNDMGSSRRTLSVGQVKNGRYMPARFQLTPVKYQELAKVQQKRGQVFPVDAQFMKRATVVYTGIHVNEIKSFDPVAGTFVADFNLWFRWDPGKNKNLDFEMTHGKVLTAMVREKYFDKKNNNNFISYSVSARMVDHFDLQTYPFDSQTLRIRIKPKLKTIEDLILVTDIDNESFIRRALDFGAWQDVNHLQFTSQKPFLWSYRNPKYDTKPFSLDHSQYNYHVIMKRKFGGYIIALLPLMVLVASAYVVFTIDYTAVSSRYSVSMTTMLSAMAYHNVNKLDVGYLVRGDLFFVSAYMLFFSVLVETSFVSYLNNTNRTDLAKKIDHLSMIVYPLTVAILLMVLF